MASARWSKAVLYIAALWAAGLLPAWPCLAGVDTATPTPTINTPQTIRVWQDGSYFLKPCQPLSVLASSLYQDQPQPGVPVHLQIIRGYGRFQGLTEILAQTGADSQPATVGFTASDRSLDVTVIRADNLSLGSVRYLLLPVMPMARKPLADTFTQVFPVPGCEWIKVMIFDSETEALGVADTLLAACLTTPSATATVSPMLTRTPTATAIPQSTLNHARSDDTAGITVYPNPAREQAVFAAGSDARSITIDIYKMTGERVAHLHEYTHWARWRIQEAATGIYLCRITVTGRNGNVLEFQTRKLAVVK